MWLGYNAGDMAFAVPADSEPRETRFWIDETGQKWRGMGDMCWFTNLDHGKRHEILHLFKTCSPEEYPKYDNYDTIEVSKTALIPCDWEGVMGVPITFLGKYNLEQFEILGIAKRGADDPALKSQVYTAEDYPNYSDLNAGTVLMTNGVPKNTCPRILIRNKKPGVLC